MLCFTAREQKAVRVEDKAAGVKKLERIKVLNPDVLGGFNQELLNMYENEFDAFKKEVLSNAQCLQARVSLGEQADMRGYLWGLLGGEYVQ